MFCQSKVGHDRMPAVTNDYILGLGVGRVTVRVRLELGSGQEAIQRCMGSNAGGMGSARGDEECGAQRGIEWPLGLDTRCFSCEDSPSQ